MPDWSEQFSALDEPQKRGQATEAIVRAALVVHDLEVASPMYDNEPYDLLVDFGRGFERAQIKTAYRNKPGTVQFETVSTRSRATGYERDGYEGRADLFVVYNPILDEIYVVPVEQAATGKMEIRFEEPENGQRVGINWHKDVLLETFLSEVEVRDQPQH